MIGAESMFNSCTAWLDFFSLLKPIMSRYRLEPPIELSHFPHFTRDKSPPPSPTPSLAEREGRKDPIKGYPFKHLTFLPELLCSIMMASTYSLQLLDLTLWN